MVFKFPILISCGCCTLTYTVVTYLLLSDSHLLRAPFVSPLLIPAHTIFLSESTMAFATAVVSTILLSMLILLSLPLSLSPLSLILLPFSVVGNPRNVLPVSIRFSISVLPSSPMQPRVSDERVGYFVTAFKDLGDHRANRHGRGSDLLNTEVRPKGSYSPVVSILYTVLRLSSVCRIPRERQRKRGRERGYNREIRTHCVPTCHERCIRGGIKFFTGPQSQRLWCESLRSTHLTSFYFPPSMPRMTTLEDGSIKKVQESTQAACVSSNDDTTPKTSGEADQQAAYRF